MDIYIKPTKKVTLSEQPDILIGDVADIVAPTHIVKKIKKMPLIQIEDDGEKKKNFLISITDIIKPIMKAYPDATVNNVGEMDIWVQYSAKKSRDITAWKWAKIAFVAVVLFIGSSTAIMSFHTDGQIPKIFERYYEIFYGTTSQNPLIISIPYSIGLAVGIVLFYNHIMGRKITDDPTPIEVELEMYDQDVSDTMIDTLGQLQNQKMEGSNHGNT